MQPNTISAPLTEVLVPAPEVCPDAEAVQEVARAIVADSRQDPESYLKQVYVAISGE